MKHVKAISIVVMLFLACGAAGAPVINGGFETGDWTGWEPPDWSVGGTEQSLEVTAYNHNGPYAAWWRDGPRSGTYSRLLHHDCRANAYHDFWQNIDISDGLDVLVFWLSVDLNPTGGLPNPGSWAGADVREYGHGDVIANLVTFGSHHPGHYGTDGWQRFEFDLRDYTSLDQLSVSFWLRTANNHHRAYDRIYVDDVELREEPAPVVLFTPNGGETLIAGSTYPMSWAGTSTATNVLIEYSADNGGAWNDVDTAANTGSYDWLVPAVDSNQCLVRISEANDPNIFDVSDVAFIVFVDPNSARAADPRPRNGAVYVRKDPRLSWTPGLYAPLHDVYFGTDFNDVNDADRPWPAGISIYKGKFDANTYYPSGILDSGTVYYWRIDEVYGLNRWKGDVWRFTTLIPPTLVAPNGGETLVGGSTYSISWSTIVPLSEVLIEYSTDNGQAWTEVNIVPNTGSYDWLVPTVHSHQCLVRVSDPNDPNANDISDAAFTMEIHVIVPDVVAMPLASAEAALLDANLIRATVSYECNDTAPEGHVAHQNPPGGTEVVIGSAVDLVVSVCDLSSIAKYFYVDDDAPPGGNGRSWAGACKYLQDALDQPKRTWSPVEIRVAEGIYRPDQNSANPDGSGDRRASFQLMNWVTTKGGYAGVGAAEPNERDVELYQTILSGDLLGNDAGFDIDDTEEIRRDPNRKDNSRHVVIGSGTDATAILDGFTITGGHGGSSSGAGMCNETGSPTLIDCLFTRNAADEGGGMFNEDGSNPTLIRCTFSQNALTDDFGGGGMCNRWNSNPTLYDCTFSQNCGTVGGSEGGGMENYRSSPTLINCVFISNMVNGDGGGMRNYRGSNPTVINCIFSGNVADDDGGGMFNRGSSPTLINCTFGANSARAGGGIYNRDHRGTPSLPIITNCILWDDTPDEIYVASGTPEVSYCDVQGGWPGEGNIDTDPCFVEPGHWDSNGLWFDGDYHLLPSSPCIDTGDPNYVPGPNETDLDGNPRVLDGDNDGNSVIDMGAYEFRWRIEALVKFTPKVLNCCSKGKWVKAHLVLPEGFMIDDVDANKAATIEQLGLESEYINIFLNEDGLVEMEIGFDRGEFCAAAGCGLAELTVVAGFTNAEEFWGADTIRIFARRFKCIAGLASQWLRANCGEPDWCGGLDLNRDSAVDFADFALFDSCCEVIE